VNVGLLGGGAYAFYTHPNLRRDGKLIASAMAATFALLGAESYAIEACLGAPNGNMADRNMAGGFASGDRSVCHHAREHVSSSGILGGTTGLSKSNQCTR
jgi:hypothetical protein